MGTPGALRTVALALAGFMALSACGLGSPSAATTPQPSRSYSASASPKVDHCANLAKRGITPCPPANLPLDKVPIANKTGGKVPDAQVQEDGQALLRWFALYRWAFVNNHSDFLQSDALAPPDFGQQISFRDELQWLASAKAAGGTLRIEPIKLAGLSIVPVSQVVAELARGRGYLVGPYEWVYVLAGPDTVDLVKPDGTSQLLHSSGADRRIYTLSFGRVRDDPDLGRVWYEVGSYDCLQYPVQETCLV
ncbi:MAG: hypothetical protein ACR2MZ_04155 [Candidatus Dormibacter sp.]|uniref:hypothetical protein n=1 Tax=Candidatus Dormibacter sp. TaxID=2973982 RepID=UPI000DB3BDFC|nr:MAG: hypothetical protein DLM66_06280 [Candidatus Dormibacteraeota bacterium]